MHYLLTVCGTKTLEDFPGLIEQLKLVDASVKIVGEVEAPPPEDLDTLADVDLVEIDTQLLENRCEDSPMEPESTLDTPHDLVIDIDLPMGQKVEEAASLLDKMTLVDDSPDDSREGRADPHDDTEGDPEEDLPHQVSIIVTFDSCTYTEGRTNILEWMYHLAILTDTNSNIPTFEIETSTLEPFTYKGFIRQLLLENWGITKKEVGYIRHAFTEKNVHAYVCHLKQMGKTSSIPTDIAVIPSASNPPACWKHLHLSVPYSITPDTLARHSLSDRYPKLEFHFGPVTYPIRRLFDVLKTARK